MNKTVDFVVVGAGAAGLTAARELNRRGHTVALIEARDRVGGRLKSEVLPDSNLTIDIGGQWVAPTQTRVHALIKEFGLDIFPTYEAGESILYLKDARSTYVGVLPELEPEVDAELDRAFKLIDEMGATIPLDRPWDAPGASELDAKSFYVWTRETVQSDFARYVLDNLATAALSSDPGELSMLHVAFYFASAGGIDILSSTGGGGQDSRFSQGFQSVATGLARDLADDIILDSPVRLIRYDDNGVTVISDKATIDAQRVIVAMSPTLTSRIDYDPPLPAERDQLSQRMPMGTAIKLMVVYEKPFWRENGLSGLVFSDLPVGLTYDNSPEDGSCGIILGFIEGRPGRYWGERTKEEREAEVIESLVKYFGPQASAHTHYIDHYWAAEKWSRGCYAGTFGPGGWTSVGPALTKPVGRIHWAGTETATEWMGYVEGAIQSGQRAADEVVACMA